MNAVQYSGRKNYYTDINSVRAYVDYINERLVLSDYKHISGKTIKAVIDFSREEGLGKIISKCRKRFLNTFRNSGFVVEGIINGFFKGEIAYCISYFVDPKRQKSLKTEVEDSIIYQCARDVKQFSPKAEDIYIIRQANTADIPRMIELFSKVFDTYPSPIFSMEYLKEAMSKHVLFKVAEKDGKIISIASADMDKPNLNAEITDCATYPEHRGKGLLSNLIYALETDLKDKGFLTAYSLSRAVNTGINKALSRLEYKYCGRMVRNCHICGDFEDMNIWVKEL